MTIYTWDAQSPVERVEVLPFGKEHEAIVHARADVDSARLAEMREMFTAQGFATVPDEVDGQYVLRLRGIRKEELVPAALEQNGFADAGQRQTAASEKKSKGGFVDKIRSSSFKISGYVYMIGDAALAVSGLKRGDVNETISGLAYGATSIVAAGYGERKPEKVFDDLYGRMVTEFAKEGVELPTGTELTAKELGKPGGLVERIENFLYNYPTQILTAGNAIAGFNLFRAGMNQGSNDKRIAGALVTTGMLIGLLVPEKARKAAPQSVEEIAANLKDGGDAKQVWAKPGEEKPQGLLGMLTTARDWVQEKPLRVGGYMALGNNAFMVKGAMTERDVNPKQREYLTKLKQGDSSAADLKDDLRKRLTKSEFGELDRLDAAGSLDHDTIDAKLTKLEKADGMWKMNMLAAASYVVANGLLSISSTKGNQGGKKGADGQPLDPNDEIYAAAAAIIANQPQEVQDHLVDKMAMFLATQREIDVPPAELAEKMREKVASVKENPWLDPAKHGKQEDVAPAAWAEREAARNAGRDAGLGGATR